MKERHLEMTPTPDEIIEHRERFCPECGKALKNQPFELFGKRQIIDIPTIKQVVTEHQVYRCKYTCAKVVESVFPVGVDSLVSYGCNIESLVGYLKVRQYLPFKRLQVRRCCTTFRAQPKAKACCIACLTGWHPKVLMPMK
jgi:transposase